MYIVCLLEAINEEINIQMPTEVAIAEWKEIVNIHINRNYWSYVYFL